MISANNLLITNGTFHQIQNISTSSKGFELLAQNVATEALHDSGKLSDPVKCHPDTRVAILAELEEWASSQTYKFPIKWVNGSAGVGKTAIMRTTAEILERKKLLLACFFFWRTGERCNTAEFLIATLAYQISISIPATRPYIERAVEERPHIFAQKLEVQSRLLIVEPITAVNRNQALPWNYPCIFVIDGLDECLMAQQQLQDVQKQCEVLTTLRWTLEQLPVPFALLIASRPEYHIQTVFGTILKDTSSSFALKFPYDASADITKFYLDKFREIRAQHPLRSFLPSPVWPGLEIIDNLVRNASGQFIYASTVIKFVGDTKKNPSHRLDAILNATAWGNVRPFQPLDVLYSTILSTVDEEDLPLTLRALGTLWITRAVAHEAHPTLWDDFFGLQHGEVQRVLLGLESLLSVTESQTPRIIFHHASLGEFLFDSRRSGPFVIDENKLLEDIAKQMIFHLHICPTNKEFLSGFIARCYKCWLERVIPSTQLEDFIEQAGILVRPQDLKMNYPLFLRVIAASKLPNKERLYTMKLDFYQSQIKQVVSLYFKHESLVFLLLFFASHGIFLGGCFFEKIIDEICPLSPELELIDREKGLHLYRHPTKSYGFQHTVSTQVFTNSVERAIETMSGASECYAKAASRLQNFLYASSPHSQDYPWPPPPGFSLFDVLRTWISKASTTESNISN